MRPALPPHRQNESYGPEKSDRFHVLFQLPELRHPSALHRELRHAYRKKKSSRRKMERCFWWKIQKKPNHANIRAHYPRQQGNLSEMVHAHLNHCPCVIHTPKGQIAVTVPMPGEHMVLNALSAAAVGLELRCRTAGPRRILPRIRRPLDAWRVQIHPIRP